MPSHSKWRDIGLTIVSVRLGKFYRLRPFFANFIKSLPNDFGIIVTFVPAPVMPITVLVKSTPFAFQSSRMPTSLHQIVAPMISISFS